MISILLKYFLGFIGLFLLQVLILNYVSLFDGWAQPYIYFYPLLTLPFVIPKKVLLLIGFATGLSIDIFTNTPGIHASATLTLAFLRPTVLKYVSPRDDFEASAPSIKNMGIKFISYSGVLVLAHHLWLFMLLYFSSGLVFSSIGHALASSVFSMIFIILLQLFSNDKKTY